MKVLMGKPIRRTRAAPVVSDEEQQGIFSGLEDVKAGRVRPLAEIVNELDSSVKPRR
jgi:predicted transcriptional regulator